MIPVIPLITVRPVDVAPPSPTPWTLVSGWEIWDANEESIACTGHDHEESRFETLINTVNAELIVAAVNGWNDVAALRARLAELGA